MSTNNGQCAHGLTVVAFAKKPRNQIYKLIELSDQLNDDGLRILSRVTPDLAGKYPRYPVGLSVTTGGLRYDVVNLLKIAELVSDEGLQKMLEKALEIATMYDGEYSRRPKAGAIIINLKQGGRS